MKTIPFPIKEVVVLTGSGTDLITINMEGPTTFPTMQYELCVKTEAQAGEGAAWVRKFLQVEPQIIKRG